MKRRLYKEASDAENRVLTEIGGCLKKLMSEYYEVDYNEDESELWLYDKDTDESFSVTVR